MRTANLANSAVRQAEVGLAWKEVILDGTGENPFEVRTTGTIRVSASGGDVGVVIDGELAMTLRSGEVELINVGFGAVDDDKRSVTVQITGAANARVQVAKEKAPGSRRT